MIKSYYRHSRIKLNVRNLSRLFFKDFIRRKILIFSLISLILILPISLIILNNRSTVEAAWMDDSYAYRQTVAIANSGAAQTNSQIKVFANADLSALISAGKLQASLNDIRFTDTNGKLLKYWIEDATNNSVDIWVLMPSIPASGTSIYFYYGNPSVGPGKSVVGTQDFPGISCKAIKLSGATTNGLYYIDPNGQAIADKYQAYCELTIDGGGWTSLIVNPAQNTTYNPFVDFGSVGNPQDGFYSIWSKRTQIAYTEVLLKPSYSPLMWASITTAQPGYFKWTDAAGTPYSRQGVYSTSIGTGGTNTYSTACTDFTPSGAYGLALLEAPQTWCTPNGTEVGFGLLSGDPRGCHRDGMKWSWGTTPGGNNVCPIPSEWKSGYVLLAIREPSVSISQTPTVAAPTNEEKSPAPLAYWKFDEGQGVTANDSSGKGKTGTFLSAPVWKTEDLCVSGKCLAFDNVDDGVSIANENFTSLTDYTMCSWVKPIGAHKNYTGTIMSSGDWNNVHWAFGINQANTIIQTRKADGVNSPTWNYTFPLSQWTHICLTRSGTTITAYANGSQVGSPYTGTTGNLVSNATNTAIGRETYAGGYFDFNGMIDEPKIYSYARTAAQIKTDFASKGSGSIKGTSVQMGSASKNSDALSNGLVGYWKMDENVGATTLDSSGNNNTATFGTTAPSWGTGKYGVGLSYDGTDYISVANNSALNFGSTGSFTISTWIKPNNVLNKAILGKGNGCNGDEEFEFDTSIGSSGDLSIYYKSGWRTSTTTALTVGTWQHIVAVVDSGTKITYYYNGSQLGNPITNISGTFGPTITNILAIGAQGACLANRFDGSLDETRIYNRALSASEVSTLYSWAPGPVGYWNFEDGSGGSVTDKSGNGSTGTWNGTGSHWTNGKYGKAGSFKYSNNDYLNLGSPASLQLTNALSVGAWVNVPDYSVFNEIVAKSDNTFTNRSFELRTVTTTGIPQFLVYTSGGSFTAQDSVALGTNAWHYVSGVYDPVAQTAKIYVDGVLKNTATSVTGTLLNPGNNLAIGALGYLTGGSGFNGSIDEAKLYNYARSSKQVVEDMNGGHPAGGSPVGSQLGYWKLDEGQGATANNTVSTVGNGTLRNAPTWSNTGKFGKALSLDGLNDYLEIPNSTAVKYTGADMTFSIWVNRDSAEIDGNRIISKPWNGSGQYNYGLGTNADGTIYFSLVGATSWTTTTTDALPANAWTQLIVTIEGSSKAVNIYMNGKLIKSDTHTIVSWTPSSGDANLPVAIGTLYPYGDAWAGNVAYSFKGSIDEVKMYSSALTANEVKLDYNRGAAMVLGDSVEDASDNPTGYWKMDEKSGTTLTDSGSGGNNATLQGGANLTSGKINGASNYVSNGDFALVSNPDNFNTTTFTIEGYLKTSIAGYKAVLARENSSGKGWEVLVDGSNAFALRYDSDNNANQTCYPTSPVINDNTWHHFALTVNGTSKQAYVYSDGVQSCSVTLTESTLTGTGGGFRFMYTPGMGIGSYLAGQLDEIKFYNYVRSSSQIKADAATNALNQVLPGAPVGEWNFEEGTGTNANDTSGNGNMGTLTNSPTWTNGKIGKGVDFNGATNKYITVTPNGTTLDLTNTGTLETWVYSNSFSTWNVLLARGNWGGGLNNFSLYYNNSITSIVGEIANGAITNRSYIPSANTLLANNWHHIVFSWDGSFTRIYLDGALAENPRSQTINASPTGNLGLGNISSGGYNYNGKLDQVRIYNYARTPAQVAYDYNRGGPVGWWKMDECQGTVANDSSGNGNTGTVTIGATVPQSSAGTCTDGLATSAWNNGKAGKYNASLNFDGVDDYVTISGSVPAATSGTISTWIYPNSSMTPPVSYPHIAGFLDPSLYIQAGTSAPYLQTLTCTVVSSKVLLASTWQHIVGTYSQNGSNTDCKIYVNGVLTGSNSAAGNVSSTARPFQIDGNSHIYQGQIDDVRVYNYALTPAQVKTLYNGGTAVQFGP